MTQTLSARADVVTGSGTAGLRISQDPRGARVLAENIVDRPPEFATISKTQLKIDAAYQRSASSARVKDYSANWSWTACGALKVALRPDGEWYVFDGGHRFLAAMLRPDIDGLPCLIYEMKTLREEAAGFLSQTAIRPMQVVDRFRALVIAGDPTAVAVKELTDESDFTIRGGVKPGDRAVGCAAELLRSAREDLPTLRKIWPLLVALVERGGMITDRVLRGMMYVEQRMAAGSMTEKKHRARLLTVGFDALNDAILKATSLEGGGNARACAIGILAALNRSTRNRLIIPGING